MKYRSDSAPRTVIGQTAADARRDAEIARLTAERDEVKADLAWMQNNRDRWQDSATQRHFRSEKAEAERDAAMAGAVKVKPLVWEQLGDRAWRAPSPFFGSFRVECYGDGPWQALWSVPGFCGTFVDGDFTTPDDAKRAIDARIRAALQPDPDARQADLAKAWMMGREDAAGAAKHAGLAFGYERAVQAIRALTPPADLAAKIGGAE